MYFLGHGAYDFWAAEQVLKGSDVPLLVNADKLSIVTALNCLNGYFVDPRVRALSELMTLSNTGGAIGYLSSSGLNQLGALELFGENFYRNVTSEQPASLGAAIAKERAKLAELSDLGPVIDTLHYFGDPDLWIPGISPVPTAPEEDTSLVDLSLTGNGPDKLSFTEESPAAEAQTSPLACQSNGKFNPLYLLLLIPLARRRWTARTKPVKLS